MIDFQSGGHDNRGGDAPPPWSTEGLHGRVSKLEGLHTACEHHQSRTDKRLQLAEDRLDKHDEEIITLKEISNELKTMNITLTQIRQDIQEPLGMYTKIKNFRDVFVFLAKAIMGAAALAGGLIYFLPWLARGV